MRGKDSTSMTRKVPGFFALGGLVVALLGFGAGAPLEERVAQDVIPGRFIVAVQPGVSPAVVALRYGVSVEHSYSAALNGFSAALSPTQVAGLAADAQVDGVVPDQRTGLAPGLTAGAAPATGTVPTGVDRIDAENAVLGPLPTNIAVLDTGSGPHKDLNVARSVNCLVSGCPKGGSDDNGHGSHVAGTAAGRADGGARGVAPGASVSSVKVLDQNGVGTIGALIAGLDQVTGWKQTLGGQWVANISIEAAGSEAGSCPTNTRPLTDLLHQAICNAAKAGVVVVVAAGNGPENAINVVPAAYDEVITVSAIADYDGKGGHLGAFGAPCTTNRGPDDTLSITSNFGKDVDLAAPGVCILSLDLKNGYRLRTGTSFATPHVTGAIALKMAAGDLAVEASTSAMAPRKAALGTLQTVKQDDTAPYAPCSFSEVAETRAEPMVYVGQPPASCQ